MIGIVRRGFSEAKTLNLQTMNQRLFKASYAVRGEIAIRSMEIEAQMRKGQKFPFESISACHVGNPQVMGQKPLTWIRQGLALAAYPELLNHPELFPPDIIEKIKKLLARVKGGIGAYSESQGLLAVREEICYYIKTRDGLGEVLPQDIFITNGASPAIDAVLNTAVSGPQDGVLTPIPQYPLYNALVTMKNGTNIGYYLDERPHKWSISGTSILKSIENSLAKGIVPKILVVINPGNPTGEVLSLRAMNEILDICKDHKLVLFADEVYQDNVYTDEKSFNSFRKVALQKNSPVEIASFHTVSKGFYGECGLRAGYAQIMNFDSKIREQLLKMVSIMLPSNSLGQIALALALHPPVNGEPSYDLYKKEKDQIIGDLKQRAKAIDKEFNKMINITCGDVEGAMYAFPRILLSKKAIDAAKEARIQPDLFYAMKLLEETGIAVVPGSGFGQQEGTYHFRITTLASNMIEILENFHKFNENFHNKYKD